MNKYLWLSPLLVLALPSYGGGLYLYETAGQEVGLASAGLAARAQDASTLLGNPAGMTQLAGNQLSVGGQLLVGDVSYQLDNSQMASPGDVLDPFPAASVFYSHSLSDELKLGVGLYGNYGLALHFDDWAGDRLIKQAALTALTLQPALAYQLNPQWSVGAGVGINYGLFALTRDVAGSDNKSKDTDWALNYHLGLMYQPTADTRLGLKYTSETEYNFALAPVLDFPLLGQQVTLPIAALVNTPQQLMFSVYHQLNPQLALMGNLGWQDWSAYGDSQVVIAGQPQASSGRLQDTWHGAIGMQYQLIPSWQLHSGIAYDSSLYQSQDNMSLTMPSGASWRFGAGAQYQLSAQSSIGADMEYLRQQGGAVDMPLLAGSYDQGDLLLFSVSYNYRF